MKVTKKILLIAILTIFAIFVGTISCYAAEQVEVTSAEILKPTSGVYGVGTNIQIELNFSERIKGTLGTLQIGFSGLEDYINIDPVVLNDYADSATYEYTIKSGDVGQLFISAFNTSGCEVETEGGETATFRYASIYNGHTGIYADTTIEWTDFSNATYGWKFSDTTHRDPSLTISNVTLNENHSYYVYFSHDNTKSFNLKTNDDLDDGWTMLSSTGRIATDILEKSGDIYVWICEVGDSFIAKVVTSAKKVERPAQLPLGSRINFYFFSDYTSTHFYEPMLDSRKVNLKIGRVTDVKILKAIKNGESGCLQQLLTYAKGADAIYTGNINLGYNEPEITSGINLVNKEYYFVYAELDDENGKYYPVEDVSLYQALISETVGKNLFNYLDDQFVWNLSETETPAEETPGEETPTKPENTTPTNTTTPKTNTTTSKTNTTKDTTKATGNLPYTGGEATLIVAVAVLFAMGIAYYKNKQYKDI